MDRRDLELHLAGSLQALLVRLYAASICRSLRELPASFTAASTAGPHELPLDLSVRVREINGEHFGGLQMEYPPHTLTTSASHHGGDTDQQEGSHQVQDVVHRAKPRDEIRGLIVKGISRPEAVGIVAATYGIETHVGSKAIEWTERQLNGLLTYRELFQRGYFDDQ